MFGSEIAHRCEECLVESGEVMERNSKESIESMCHHGGDDDECEISCEYEYT